MAETLLKRYAHRSCHGVEEQITVREVLDDSIGSITSVVLAEPHLMARPSGAPVKASHLPARGIVPSVNQHHVRSRADGRYHTDRTDVRAGPSSFPLVGLSIPSHAFHAFRSLKDGAYGQYTHNLIAHLRDTATDVVHYEGVISTDHYRLLRLHPLGRFRQSACDIEDTCHSGVARSRGLSIGRDFISPEGNQLHTLGSVGTHIQFIVFWAESHQRRCRTRTIPRLD